MISRGANATFVASLVLFIIHVEGPWTFGNKDPCADDNIKEKDSSSSGMFSRMMMGTSDEKLEERAYNLFRKRKFEKAILCFDKVIKKFPRVAKYYRDRGICHLSLLRYDSAIADFTQLLELESDNIKGRILLAEALSGIGKFYDAIENLLKAYKEAQVMGDEKQVNEIVKLRSNVQVKLKERLQKGWPQEGQAVLTARNSDHCGPGEGAKLTSDSPIVAGKADGVTADVLNEQGNGHFARVAYEAALRCYDKAIEQNKSGAPATVAKYHRNRGSCYRKLLKPVEALNDIEKSLDLDPQSVRGRFLLAQLRFDADEYQDTEKILNEILTEFSISGDEEIQVKTLLKKAVEYTRDPCAEYEDEEIGLYSQECRLDIQEKIDDRANLLFILGRFQEALACYNKAIKNMPKEPKYYRKRGFCHSKLGKLDLAVADYEQLLALLSHHAATQDRLLLIRALIDAARHSEAYYNLEIALAEGHISHYEKEEVITMQEDTVRRIEELNQKEWLQEGNHIQEGTNVSTQHQEMETDNPSIENDASGFPEVTPDELNERGNILFAAEEYSEALSCYNKAIERNSGEMKYYRNRAWCHKRLGDLEMAYADLKVLLDTEALDVRTWYLLVSILFHFERYDEASEHLKVVLKKKILSVMEEIPFRHMLKKIIYGRRERCIDGAEEELREWFPESTSSLLDSPMVRADRFFDSGKYEEALSCYNRAIQDDPRKPISYKKRGLCHTTMGRPDLAAKDFEKLVELTWSNVRTEDRLLLIRALYDVEKYCQAHEHIEKALVLCAPDYKKELLSLKHDIIKKLEEKVRKSYWLQETTNNRSEVGMLVPQATNDAEIVGSSYELNERGNVLFAAEYYSKALNCYNKAIEFNPTEAKFYRNRAWCYKCLSKLGLAFSDLKVSLSFDALNTRCQYLFASILTEFKEYKEASKNLEHILNGKNLSKEEEIVVKSLFKDVLEFRRGICDESAEDEIKLWFPNAEFIRQRSAEEKAAKYFAEESYEEARLCYNKAIEHDPDNRNLYKNRGICHLALGKPDSALADFEKMVKVTPFVRVGRGDQLLLTEALYDSGRYYDAYKYVQKCKALAEDDGMYARREPFATNELKSLREKVLNKLEVNMASKWSQEGEVIEALDDADENNPCVEETSPPTSDSILNARGNGFFAENRYAEACTCYSKAIDANRGEASYHRNRATCFGKLELAQSAIADLETAMRLEPRNARNLFLLARILSEFKEDHKLVVYQQEAKKDELDLSSEEEVLWDIVYEKALRKEEEWLRKERARKGKGVAIEVDPKKDKKNGRNGASGIRIVN